MKRLFLFSLAELMSAFLVASSGPIERLDKHTIQAMDENQLQARFEILEARVLELESMSWEDMDKAERKATKKELRYIQKEMKAIGNGGIYVSTTALVIIIILLIIF